MDTVTPFEEWRIRTGFHTITCITRIACQCKVCSKRIIFSEKSA